MKDSVSFAVFAHNEQDLIGECLDSLLSELKGLEGRIVVLVNGSSDRTLEIVKSYQAHHSNVEHVNLKFGDKANAWNYYVHSIADESSAHFFVDGDITISERSVKSILEVMASDEHALAFSTLPSGGRKSKSWARTVMKYHGLPGAFYGLPNSTLKAMRDIQFYMPVGLVGDDTYLQWILKRSFDPEGTVDKKKVRPVSNAYFLYESRFIFDLGFHIARQRRYALRDIQMRMLEEHLKDKGIKQCVAHISDLYPDFSLARHIPTTWKLKGRDLFVPSQALKVRKRQQKTQKELLPS